MIPKACIKKIMKDNGAERISAEAIDELQLELEEMAGTIAANSVKMAAHAGRKTIKASDIVLAI